MPHYPPPDQSLLLKLSKLYTQAFSPLLLPKIAKLCLAVKGSPMAVAFAAKIKLYDHTALKKQDLLVRKVKIKLNNPPKPLSNTNIAIKPNPASHLHHSNPNSSLTSRNRPVKIANRLTTQISQCEKSSIFKIPQIKELAPQKNNWDQIISAYQEIYEFIRILDERLSDLQDFVSVLKNINLQTIRFENIEKQLKKLITNAHKAIYELLPPDMFHRVFNEGPKTDKFKWLVRKGKNNLFTENGKLNSGIKDQQSKLEGSFLFGDGQKTKRTNFLKKSGNKICKGNDQNTNGTSVINSSFKCIAKQFQSTKPQKSFLIKSSKSIAKSKNTHEKLSQDLENEHEEKMLRLRCPFIKMNGRKRSETLIHYEPNLKRRKAKSWDNIMSVQVVPKFRISIMPNNQVVSDNNIETPPLADTQKTFQTRSNRQSNQLKSNRASGRLTMENQNQYERKSQFLDSHSSISSGKGSKRTLQGFKKLGTKVQDENLYDDRNAIKKRQGQRKRLRAGQMKKQVIRFSQEQLQQDSIREPEPVLEGPQKYVRSRRKGKALPINMNVMFQRILQDEAIQKIVQANQERQNQNLRNADLKKTLLKRRNQGTYTSISGGVNSQQDWLEEYDRNINRLQRQKDEVPFADKDSCRINYSDILQLKKSLKPIASYNESKMITRYSSQRTQVELMDFQFKYKQNKLVFNHEFCLRKDEEHRKGGEGDLEREKSVKEENERLDFMQEFKKCLERTEMPKQKGLEAAEKVWGDF